MGLLDGWPFKSKEQIEKERRQFAKRVLPHGDAQKEKALAALRPLLAKKLRDDEILYAFINTKDKYSDAETPEEALDNARHALKGQAFFSEDDRRAVLALVRLEAEVESLEHYPTTRDVQVEMALLD